MIETAWGMELKPATNGGWELIFWMGDAFNFETPFREALQEIVRLITPTRATALELPPREQMEDFIDGRLAYGDTNIGVYFEYSLSYLSLTAAEREPLEEIKSILTPHVVASEAE